MTVHVHRVYKISALLLLSGLTEEGYYSPNVSANKRRLLASENLHSTNTSEIRHIISDLLAIVRELAADQASTSSPNTTSSECTTPGSCQTHPNTLLSASSKRYRQLWRPITHFVGPLLFLPGVVENLTKVLASTESWQWDTSVTFAPGQIDLCGKPVKVFDRHLTAVSTWFWC